MPLKWLRKKKGRNGIGVYYIAPGLYVGQRRGFCICCLIDLAVKDGRRSGRQQYLPTDALNNRGELYAVIVCAVPAKQMAGKPRLSSNSCPV